MPIESDVLESGSKLSIYVLGQGSNIVYWNRVLTLPIDTVE